MSEWNGWPKSNRGDIIRMAREVADIETDNRGREEFIFDSYGIERFANLVAAAEREACAKACEVFSVDRGMIEDEILKKGVLAGASMCAFAIRERGAP
jgi:hypothetical protein